MGNILGAVIMDFTNVIAWYGAIIATLVLMWDIYKWKTSGPKIKLSANPDMQIMDGGILSKEKYITINVSNIGSAKTTITHVVGIYYKSFIHKLINKSSSQFLIPTPAFAKAPPYILDINENWVACVTQESKLVDFMTSGCLYFGVHDVSKKKPWLCRVTPNKDTIENQNKNI